MKKAFFMIFGLTLMGYGVYWVLSLEYYHLSWINDLSSNAHWLVARLGWLPLFLGGLLLFNRKL